MARGALSICSAFNVLISFESSGGSKKRHLLRCTQIVHADLQEVFDFFEDPMNLERITPSWLHFHVQSVSDVPMRLGTRISYRLRWQAFPMTWRSRISDYEPDSMFSDEMLSGPYRRWYHRHYFENVESGVLMTDLIEYELPLGPLGELTHSLVVRSQLKGIFEFRRLAIERIFPASPNLPLAQGDTDSPA
ncbi:MAG: SRPBCC family protein [Longimicrobiales bacterium]|nr:SRPBCC family protein [Longimicrobiales bacterium]